ncbi:MAG TPA: RICIN domain-containing protein [Rugosimonospora sp.]|nr:RICIN domain-containing protein [Rugosimonospora sp.]
MRTRRWLSVGVAALLGGLILAPAAAANAADSWGKAANAGNGQCIDVKTEDGTGNGARVQEWNCNGGDEQLWVRASSADGTVNLVNKWTGKCLQPIGGSPVIGATMEVWDCNGSRAQQWTFTGSGPRMIHNLNSGLCLRVPTTDRINGRWLDQQPCDPGNTLETWWF